MIEKNVEVNLAESGARPIAKLVQIASQYQSRVSIRQNSKTVNAKSIMGMMTLGLVLGQSLDVEIEGEDEKDAMYSIEQYLLGK
ncbi:MAG: HPr family phosphocarrier protein [Eubacterium sp.]|nr:HPr family phosphocarrier protein [Eubacterium sp.]